MARHSDDSDVRAWAVVWRQLLVTLTRQLGSWFVLVLISVMAGCLVGGVIYLLSADLTSDTWLSGTVGVLAGVLTTFTVLYRLADIQTEDAPQRGNRER